LVDCQDLGQIQLVGHIRDEPRQMTLWNPILQRGREEENLIQVAGAESLAHRTSIADGKTFLYNNVLYSWTALEIYPRQTPSVEGRQLSTGDAPALRRGEDGQDFAAMFSHFTDPVMLQNRRHGQCPLDGLELDPVRHRPLLRMYLSIHRVCPLSYFVNTISKPISTL
jgi:hypothetical protein